MGMLTMQDKVTGTEAEKKAAANKFAEINHGMPAQRGAHAWHGPMHLRAWQAC